MGLAFNFGDATISYSGFNRCRKLLAGSIGLVYEEMRGFGGNRSWDNVHHPVIPLLNHSDCDGHLTLEECQRMLPLLDYIVNNWVDGYEREFMFKLMRSMREAVNARARLEFC